MYANITNNQATFFALLENIQKLKVKVVVSKIICLETQALQ